MAATITLTTAARNAAADAIVGQMGTAAVLTIATTAFASTLATIALSNPAYGASSGGVATMSGTPLQDTSADNTGTAAVWRIRTSGAQTVLSGTLATTATGADITLDDVARNAAVNAIVDLIDVGGAGDIQFTTSHHYPNCCHCIRVGCLWRCGTGRAHLRRCHCCGDCGTVPVPQSRRH